MQYLEAPDLDPAKLVEQEQWQSQHKLRMANALQTLDERSRSIIQRRWLHDDKTTLQDLADEYGVSAERVRQLENNAMKKLRSAIVL